MVRLLLRDAAIAFAAAACSSCGSDANGTPTTRGLDSGSESWAARRRARPTMRSPLGHDTDWGVDVVDSGGADAPAEADVASAAFPHGSRVRG
jgi:hypothetical protein